MLGVVARQPAGQLPRAVERDGRRRRSGRLGAARLGGAIHHRRRACLSSAASSSLRASGRWRRRARWPGIVYGGLMLPLALEPPLGATCAGAAPWLRGCRGGASACREPRSDRYVAAMTAAGGRPRVVHLVPALFGPGRPGRRRRALRARAGAAHGRRVDHAPGDLRRRAGGDRGTAAHACRCWPARHVRGQRSNPFVVALLGAIARRRRRALPSAARRW